MASNRSGNVRPNRTTIIKILGEKMVRKTNLWIFKAGNWLNPKQEHLDMATKRKPEERN